MLILYVPNVNTLWRFFMFENIFCDFECKNVRNIAYIAKVLRNFVSQKDSVMKHRIKELIKEKGYTQQGFADKLGITRSTLLEQIGEKPSAPTLDRIAETLGVEMWELFTTREEILAKSPGEITCPYCEKRFSLKS